MKANIFNIQKFSIHDGPGIRTTVFFKGCPLSCLWCSNPESQSACTQLLWDQEKCLHCHKCMVVCPRDSISSIASRLNFNAATCIKCRRCVQNCPATALELSGQEMTVSEVMDEVRQDMAFYEESGGGVTLSGGEVLVWPDFVAELLEQLQKEGISTALETTGYAEAAVFQRVAAQADLLLFDMKHHNEKKHQQFTGVSNEKIIRNMAWAADEGIPIIVRIPVIPGINDSLADAAAFVKRLARMKIQKVDLLPFHQFGEKKYDSLQLAYAMKETKALHPEDLVDYTELFTAAGFDVKI